MGQKRRLKPASQLTLFPGEIDESLFGHGPVAGVDEVGRGPLAGPVVAAAVILDPQNIPVGLDDSKKLTAAHREALEISILETSIVAIGEASVEEVDAHNILQATFIAMRRAVANLPVDPVGLLVDGNQDPGIPIPTQLVKGGDARVKSIAAASIIAKVYRDAHMKKIAGEYPEYGWERNAGYGVPEHLAALDRVGISPHHRISFAPVSRVKTQKTLTRP